MTISSNIPELMSGFPTPTCNDVAEQAVSRRKEVYDLVQEIAKAPRVIAALIASYDARLITTQFNYTAGDQGIFFIKNEGTEHITMVFASLVLDRMNQVYSSSHDALFTQKNNTSNSKAFSILAPQSFAFDTSLGSSLYITRPEGSTINIFRVVNSITCDKSLVFASDT